MSDLKVTKYTKNLLKTLHDAEIRAIKLVKMIDREGLESDDLNYNLCLEQVSEADLVLAAVFLAGYLSGENLSSRFDCEVFGEQFSLSGSKSKVVHSALLTLLTVMKEREALRGKKYTRKVVRGSSMPLRFFK